jgi:hypothetical protein
VLVDGSENNFLNVTAINRGVCTNISLIGKSTLVGIINVHLRFEYLRLATPR